MAFLFLCIRPGSPAGGTRAQRAHADAHRLGERSHLAHPGIVMQTHIDDVTGVLTYEDLRGVILAGTSRVRPHLAAAAACDGGAG